MRVTGWNLLIVLVTVTSQAIFTASEECESVEVTDATDSNGCAYPACANIFDDDDDATFQDTLYRSTCVHDKTFCAANQQFITASELLEAGKICSCKDILNYPTAIGACLTKGRYLPIARDDDCVEDGTVVCPSDLSFFLSTEQQFTACDLKCDAEMGHASISVSEETYKDYSFPKFNWTVASQSEFNILQAHHYGIIGDTLYLGGTISPIETCYKDEKIVPSSHCIFGDAVDIQSIPDKYRHLLMGPFTGADPTSESGSFIKDDGPINTDLQARCIIAQVDKDSGLPIDLDILQASGDCIISSLDIGRSNNENVIVAAGHHIHGSEILADTETCTNQTDLIDYWHTKCEAGQTTIKAIDRDSKETAFVFLKEANSGIRWLIQPWITLIKHKKEERNVLFFSTFVTGSSVDANGDVYITGYRIERMSEGTEYYVGMISKHSRVDGSVIWEEDLPGVQSGIHLVHDASEGVMYVSFEIPKLTWLIPGTDMICDSAMLEVDVCNVLARVSANDEGVLHWHWVRYAYGSSGMRKFYPKPQLAHSEDGSYIYAAFIGTGSLGPIDLDRGTSYSGCESDNGSIKVKTLEVDSPLSDLTSPLTSTICSARNLGTYFNRDSEGAVPAHIFNSRALCGGNNASEDCLVKYNKYTGRPIWGSVMPFIDAFQPVADGIMVTGTIHGEGSFDTIKIASPATPGLPHSVVYQSKIDRNGKGLYVQPIISHQSNAHSAGLTHDPVTGDIYIGLMTESSKTHFGPGAPVGFTQDLALAGEYRFPRVTIAKLGIEITPFCIKSALSDYSIIADECLIGQICYNKGDRDLNLNLPCQECAPFIQQDKWTPHMVGLDYCHIDGVCYNEGEYLSTRFSVSKCHVCTPDKSSITWSLQPGYQYTDFNPPDDCVIDVELNDEDDVDDRIDDDEDDYDGPYDDDDDKHFTTSAEEYLDDLWFDDKFDDDDDFNDDLKFLGDDDEVEDSKFANYASLGIEYVSLIVLGFVFLMSVTGYAMLYFGRRNDEPEFFPVEGCDIT